MKGGADHQGCADDQREEGKECADRHTETGMITREDKGSAERQMEEWMCSHQKSNMQIIRERDELIQRRRDAIRETLTPRKEWITREKTGCADRHGEEGTRTTREAGKRWSAREGRDAPIVREKQGSADHQTGRNALIATWERTCAERQIEEEKC